MNKSNLSYALLLTLGAFIWGLAFIFQSAASNYIGPCTINAIRFFLATLFLLPFSVISLKKDKKVKKIDYKACIIGGILGGVFLIIASILQQIGISTTSTSKSGFITAFYIVLVPLFELIIFRKKCGINVYIAILIALIGLGFLCIKGDFSIEIGDFYLFIGALFFAFHIIAVDKFMNNANPIFLSNIQMAVASLISFILMLILESNTMENLLNSLIPILYLGIFSSGVAYTIQVISQKHLNSTVASLIMSLESVFSCLLGVLIYTFYKFTPIPQYLTLNEIIGSIVMFLAIILSEIPEENFKKIKFIKKNQ